MRRKTRWDCIVPGCRHTRIADSSWCRVCALRYARLYNHPKPAPQAPKKGREPWTRAETASLVTAVIEFMMAIEGMPLTPKATQAYAKLRMALDFSEGEANY